VWAHLSNKGTPVAAGLRAAWAAAERRIDVRFGLDQLPSNRWIGDVARLHFGAGSRRQRSVAGM
jgi:hypothetical protein